MNVLLCLLLLYDFQLHVASTITKDSEHHTSCLTLSDGLHYIRPSGNDNRFPSILVRCSNSWTILDYTIDPNIEYYFSSFSQITNDLSSMDVSFEHKNWNHWLQINQVDFAISDDCNSCQIETSDDYNKAYYMTGNYFGCSFATQLLCDMDTDTNQCYQCSLTDDNDVLYNGICTHSVLSIYDEDINNERSTHKKCVSWEWNYLPSLGINGKHCICIKPKSSHNDWIVDALYLRDDDIDKVEIEEKEEEEIDCNRIYELTSMHFEYGTYRIKRCGIYKLMEDISLNMNAPNTEDMDSYYFSPNDVTQYHWIPTIEQQLNDQYPSINFIGPYSLGFFAGITVETDNVVIDLNGYELKMDRSFYIQQRFFSLIELASRPFIDNQGPSNWGAMNEIFASNVIIKDGVLGLTSHQSIHGNNNKDIHIKNVKMFDFEVAAITMNGFNGLIIENVDIGPNYQNIPVTPQYGHARFMLQRLQVIDDKMNKFVFIGNQKYTAMDIINDLQNEMDEAFEFSVNTDDIDEDDEIFNNLFINKDGLPRGGTLYGIFLNSHGFNVLGLGKSPQYSTDLTLKNINIKDLRNNPKEVVRLKLQRGPFNDCFDIKRVVGIDGIYSGNTYSNSQYTLNKLMDDHEWHILGNTFISDEVSAWIADKRNEIHLNPLQCNNDIMLHQTKGIIGIRIDNIKNIKIDGYINIEKLHNLGEFGETLCGKYYKADNGGYHHQIYPQQIGYTGNEVHGITFIGSDGIIMNNADIIINNLLSARGNVYGIQLYPNCNIEIHDNVNININNIHAGAYLTGKDLLSLKTSIIPNTVPRVCLFDIWQNQNNQNNQNQIQFIGDNINVESECVTQYTLCSFEYWKIDDIYSFDDVLNVEYIKNINNRDCMFDIDTENVLTSLSKTSDYDLESLNLLKLQLNKQTQIKTFNANKYNYGYILLFAVLFLLIIMIIKCLLNSSTMIKYKNMNEIINEESPLLHK